MASTGNESAPSRSRLHTIPLSSGPIDPAADLTETDPAGSDLVLVQWERFGDPGAVRRIASSGARLVQPLAPVSYLVWADGEQTRRLRAMRGIRWVGVFPSHLRVSDTVTPATTRLRVTFVGAPVDLGLPVVAAATHSFTAVQGAMTTVEGSASDAARIATHPRVYSVADGTDDPQLRDERSNQVVAAGTPKGGVKPGYAEFLKKIGADGSGVIVSHVDGGVDINHPELTDRVKECIDYTPVPFCTARNHDDVIGHGTHTAGIVAGTGSTGLGDLDGFKYGQGVAPGASLVVQNAINALSPGADTNGSYRPLYLDASKAGAIVSQNSWGPEATPQGYDKVTREFDSIVRDANDKKAGDQGLALVFSVMNGSGGKSTQGSPDEGKNIIGVGGTGNRGRGAPGHDDLCTCSAHGPALDGRLLPTIVAPGQQVISTRATQGTLCGTPFLGWSPTTPALETPPSPLHAGCTGTSMASPHVSGGYAVFVDWYRGRYGKRTPSPALVKAAFVNGAEDLAGGKDADGAAMTNIPNNQQGWGRFNLGNVISSWRLGAVHVDGSEVLTSSGQSFTTQVKAVDPDEPIKVTLTWTDALGPGLGKKTPAWVNDLDLVVRGDSTWLGNVFSKGWSATGGNADRKNNLENVYVRKAGSGVYTITVDAANLIGDGLPNRKGAVDQDFALVITNAKRA